MQFCTGVRTLTSSVADPRILVILQIRIPNLFSRIQSLITGTGIVLLKQISGTGTSIWQNQYRYLSGTFLSRKHNNFSKLPTCRYTVPVFIAKLSFRGVLNVKAHFANISWNWRCRNFQTYRYQSKLNGTAQLGVLHLSFMCPYALHVVCAGTVYSMVYVCSECVAVHISQGLARKFSLWSLDHIHYPYHAYSQNIVSW